MSKGGIEVMGKNGQGIVMTDPYQRDEEIEDFSSSSLVVVVVSIGCKIGSKSFDELT